VHYAGHPRVYGNRYDMLSLDVIAPSQSELGISIQQVVTLAGHLVYWGKAKVVTKIRRTNVYRVRIDNVRVAVWDCCVLPAVTFS
jgi:hypothetical protein